MTPTTRLLTAARIPLVRNTAALVANTAINGVLGLLYWVAAARLYDPTTVGLGAGAVSGLVFVASIGWIGIQQVLLRYLPVAGAARGRLIVAVYASAIGIALVSAVVFLVYASGNRELQFLAAGPLPAVGFLSAVVVWVVFSLQDPALFALGKAHWVPAENLAFGLAKLGLLVAFAGLASPWAIFGSWILGAAWLVFVVNAAVARAAAHVDPAAGPGGSIAARRIARFAIGQHVVAVLAAAPDSLAPLIVLGLLGGEATAYYYAAWTISFSVRLLAVNLGSAVTVEGARQGSAMPDRHHIRRLVMIVVVPAAAAAWLLAGVAMSIYGIRYAEHGTDLLRVLLVAVVPFTGTTLFLVGERIAERIVASLAIVGTTTLVTVGLDLALLPRLGLVGAGWAMLVAQTLAFVMTRVIIASRVRPG
jgi:O-antigen/teichoic acid export membrane protein